jgi:hypothetical protein
VVARFAHLKCSWLQRKWSGLGAKAKAAFDCLFSLFCEAIRS